MDYTATRHVRIYTELSATGRLLGYYGRALLGEIVRQSDFAGLLKLPDESEVEDPALAVASALEAPVDAVSETLPLLLQSGTVEFASVAAEEGEDLRFLVVRNYLRAQYSSLNASARKRLWRERRGQLSRAVDLGIRTEQELREVGLSMTEAA